MKKQTLLLALVGVLSACSKPEPLLLGSVELPYATVADAAEDLQQAYQGFGIETLRSHLIQFGLGQAALLHAAHPDASLAARKLAETYAEELRQGTPFEEVMRRWCEASGFPMELDTPAKPHPSDLGASVAAAVAVLEPGEWSGPLKTTYGWEVVFLVERKADVPRNRAQVILYRLLFAVGTPEDRQRIDQEWAAVSFGGNPELLRALPLSLRMGRVQKDSTE